ncbi:FAD-binding protein [Allokutzneria sp. A3M-2-11 16]|uniref:FAD-binding protein n=1 Tax=Allokutzneria sp. A3M-2-11 16 TaxID=2962043 RepID=UPI0020B8B526|nr:FAD-binding protein [Allokutzneria sp. A3M-2-11 16]MCP3803997.1 FAD-binding protein [Allokutzneria sp. A3M-2-11 16]
MNRAMTLTAHRPIAGFDRSGRQWTVDSHAGGLVPLPELSGRLLTDPATLTRYGRDTGNIVAATPAAVLVPASVDDVQEMVRYCHRLDIPVTARGEAHTTGGQSLVDGGLVIDMTALTEVHQITTDWLEADAGASWRSVAYLAAQRGRRAECLPGYLRLTLGGTLSVGGFGPNFRSGGLVDQVLAVEVVTGTGERLWCAPGLRPDLFDAVLGGLGQCGIITRVRLRLLPAPERARTYLLHYADPDPALTAMRTLIERDEIDGVFAMVVPPTPASPPLYQVRVQVFHDGIPPEREHTLRDLPDGVSAPMAVDETYLDHISEFDTLIDDFRERGWDDRVKPRHDVLLPDETVAEHVGAVVPALTREDWGPQGFVMLMPHRARAFGCPRLRIPADTELVWLFDLLTVAPAHPGRGFTERMLARNRRLWARARALGGVHYPLGTTEFGQREWREHYGVSWLDVLTAKKRYDPEGILGTGAGIFG